MAIELKNIYQVTQEQYETLVSGGTINGHSYDSSALYLVENYIIDANTAHSHVAGEGLTGYGNDGISNGTYTYKLKLRIYERPEIVSSSTTPEEITENRFYGVQLDSAGYPAVYVPWEETDLTGYVKGTGLTTDKILLGNGGSNIKTSSKGISTSVGTDDTTVPTSKAVKTFVEGKGYITSDTKVTNTLNTTTKYFVTGTTSNTTNTDTQIFDTAVYVNTTAGALHATTYNIDTNATMKYDSTNQCIRFVIV